VHITPGGNPGPVCRLRALPQGTNPFTADLSAYSGPILNVDTLQTLTSGPETYGFDLWVGSGSGDLLTHSAGSCGDDLMDVLMPDLSRHTQFGACAASLSSSTAVGASGPVRVDGHVALLPYDALIYSGGGSSLSLTTHAAGNGQVTWTESAPLVRCTDTDSFPPGPGTCPTLVDTGVTFTRSGTFDAAGHQVRLRDSFRSTNGHAHTVKTVYSFQANPPQTGDLGFRFPGRPGFRAGTAGQHITGLPTGAATVLVRSDRFSAEGDPEAETRGFTWSRTPRSVSFAPGDATTYAVAYTLKVPANRDARLAFTDSAATLTSTAAGMGARAANAMMPKPRITQPSNKAVISGPRTVVRGAVTAGANGLPVAVTVNGHPATLTRRSAARATFKAVFDESRGTHTVKAVARDAGGNKRSTSITVRNK
jgi:hypothetical protein